MSVVPNLKTLIWSTLFKDAHVFSCKNHKDDGMCVFQGGYDGCHRPPATPPLVKQNSVLLK